MTTTTTTGMKMVASARLEGEIVSTAGRQSVPLQSSVDTGEGRREVERERGRKHLVEL